MSFVLSVKNRIDIDLIKLRIFTVLVLVQTLIFQFNDF